MKKTLFLIFAAYAAMAAARPSSTRFEPVRDSGGCRYCAVYAHCLKVLKGRHLAEALRIIAAHRAVCTRQGNK